METSDEQSRERKLASIQRVLALEPIEGADKIEVATILGWRVVVEKGLYKEGDLVIYCEVDSLLPIRPEFEFLERGGARKKMLVDGKEVEGYRVKTIKLRGQISQGIVFPLSILDVKELKAEDLEFSMVTDDNGKLAYLNGSLPEGTDLTKMMGVHKYEMPLPSDLAGKARGGWPGMLPKTDEPRLQAHPYILEDYAGVEFYVTEKIDGSSVTVFVSNKDNELHVCGRTIDWLDDGKNTIWRVVKELGVEEKLRSINYGGGFIALQGEIFGPNIQSNPLKQSKVHIRFYNAYNYTQGQYLGYAEFKLYMEQVELDTVPVIDEHFKLLPTVDEMVKYATRNSVINPDVKLEGLVFRPLMEYRDPDLGRLSFKVISPEYLLKHES